MLAVLQAMEAGLREVCRSVRIGKILIQRVNPNVTEPGLLISFQPHQQDEETALPKLFYSKVTFRNKTFPPSRLIAACQFPQDIAKRYVLLLDPMLGEFSDLSAPAVLKWPLVCSAATGGSAMKAVEVLAEHGVPEDRIIFINLIASPEGLRTFCGRYPALKVVCLDFSA